MKAFRTIFGLAVLTVIAILSVNGNSESGIVFATLGMYTSSMQTYRKLLEQRMQTVAWNCSFWKAFMGFVGGKKSMFDDVVPHGVKGTQKATGQPLEVLQNFRHEGGISMDIPIFYPLTGRGVSGNVQLQGKGEKPKLGTLEVNINQQRHAYLAQDNKMSKQILQSPAMVKQLMRRANEYLGDWFNRWNSYQPYLAFLEGYSENLTKSATAEGGLGKAKASHMNIYVAGSGKVSFSTTTATYEAAVAAALNGLTDTSSDHFSTDVIENMVYVASHNHRITPITINGIKVYPIVISDAASKQLQADETWNTRLLNAAERSLDGNPLFQGKVAGIYGGALLLIDETVPSAYINGDSEFTAARATLGTTAGVCYGTNDANGFADFMENPVDPGNRKPAILFGKSAVGVGVANDLSFEEETWDFKQKIEIGADMIVGFQRSDILDNDGYWGTAGDKRKENVSSLIAFTYSPSDASWT